MILTLFCYTFRMNKISDGYYYEVYDLNNGKVLKKKKAFSEITKAFEGKNRLGYLEKIYKTRKHIRYCERVTETIKKSLIPKELLANPLCLNKTDYEQDKVVLLMDYFDSHSLQENKLIVDSYIDLTREFLGHGIHDNVYKFKNGYGINASGKVVCIDFNEMIFSKEKVLELVSNEEWRKQAQFTKFPEGELKEYIGEKFKEILNSEIINKYWNSYRS